jgi:uncharacterized protein
LTKDAETLRRAYEALNRGDIEGALAPLRSDAEWYESSEFPGPREYHGIAEIRAHLDGFLEGWEELDQQVDDVRERGERVCLLLRLRARGRGSGAAVDARYAHVWTMREGRGVRVDAYYDPEDGLRALEEPG